MTPLPTSLRQIREQAGLSRSRLAQAMDRDPSMLWRIEHGKAGASIETIEAWAAACGRSVVMEFPPLAEGESPDAIAIRNALPSLNAADLALVRGLVERLGRGAK